MTPEPREVVAERLTSLMRNVGMLGSESIVRVESSVLASDQRSRTVRMELTYDKRASVAPESVVVKDFFGEVDEHQWVLTEREVRFYRDVVPTLAAMPGLPRVISASMRGSEGAPEVVLADPGDVLPGDPVAGISMEAAVLAVDLLGHLHSRTVDDAELYSAPWAEVVDSQSIEWLRQEAGEALDGFLAERGSDLPRRTDEVLRRAVAGRLKASMPVPLTDLGGGRFSLLHGRPDADALALDSAGRLAELQGWGRLSCGDPVMDIAWLLGGSLSIADRRAHEETFLRSHIAALRTGGADIDSIAHRDRYEGALLVPLLHNVAGTIAEPKAVLRRRATAVVDHFGW